MLRFPNQVETHTSSQIAAIGYDPAEKRLYMRFRRGYTEKGAPKPADPTAHYVYENVEQADFDALMGVGKTPEDGHSIGSHFGKTIKVDKARWPYQRVAEQQTEETEAEKATA